MLETVVLLRHALAGIREAWEQDDFARPLDVAGIAQSMALVAGLADWPIEEIWTSPAVRCRHTVAAVAAERRLPVYDAEWLGVGTPHEHIAAALPMLRPTVLLCTHGESVESLLQVLTGEQTSCWPVDLIDRGLDKGAAWGLRFDQGALVKVTSIPVPLLDPEVGRDADLDSGFDLGLQPSL